jgi:hypothetical protein
MTETDMQSGESQRQPMKLPALLYGTDVIHQRSEMLSLTDMWRAARSPEGRRPNDWLALSSTAEFREAVEASFNAGKSGIETTRGGKAPGTWAHWQIALAYAKYLSPEFHMWCNTVVRERMEGRHHGVPVEMAETLERMFGICRMLSHKVAGLERAVPAIATDVLPAMVQAAVSSSAFAIRRGKTAGQIWREHGFPPIRLGGWFSVRLREMGCEIDGGGRGELGLCRARLFDPDRADAWLKNGGRLIVERKIAERAGQGALRLVAAK